MGQSARASVPTCRVLGFTGWRICDETSCIVSRGQPAVDELLLAASKTVLPETVFSHLEEETGRLLTANDDCPEPSSEPVNGKCTAPVVGPDDPEQVHFDVQNDDVGCFVTEQGNNNCYDYGNDIVTNTFAQPGRGTGVCPPNARPCVDNTCDAVKNAAIHDGLQWVALSFQRACPRMAIMSPSTFGQILISTGFAWTQA